MIGDWGEEKYSSFTFTVVRITMVAQLHFIVDGEK